MASIVTITAVAETVTCSSDGKAEHVFTVSNSRGEPLRIGSQVLVEGQAQEGWFTIGGESERELAPNGTDQIAVRMRAPSGTVPGQYKFRLLVYSVKRPGEDFTEGPVVAVKVPAPTTPPSEPEKKRGFPWWIVAVVVAVLIIGGVTGWLLWPKGVEVPNVVGQDRELAKSTIEAAALAMGSVTSRETDQQPEDTVVSQNPPAGSRVEKGTPVDVTAATPERIEVPEVVGQDFRRAKNIIESARLEPGTVTTRETDERPRGYVLAQEPPAGSRVEKGTRIDLVVATPTPLPEPIELAPLASEARWAGGQLVDAHNMRNVQRLPWMGRDNDDRGFVRMDRVRMEDGSTVTALRMHPMWVDRGTIKGWFPWVDLPRAATIQFQAQIGFLQGARHTDGVTFMVWEHHREGGREVWNLIASETKGYTGRLQTITGDLSHLAGQEVSMELRVDAGNSSGQDWAAWVDPRIVFER